MILFALPAFALTLDEAVHRAGEVDPDALVADCQAKLRGLKAGEAWAALTVTPELKGKREWQDGATQETWTFKANAGFLDAGGWFDAFQKRAAAQGAAQTADAARLDAEYYAAELYAAVVAADASLAAAKHGADVAVATQKATDARVAAGMESELLGKSAAIDAMSAQAQVERAAADLTVARLALARALQVEPDGLTVEPMPTFPPGDLSADHAPTVLAARSALTAAKLGHGQRIAEFFPVGVLKADTDLTDVSWRLTAGFTWTLPGVAGPLLREREAALTQRIAAIQLDATVRDVEEGVAAAEAQARAATKVADAAHAREQLAEQALEVGQARLQAGLAATLEVLRLQDDAARARADRVTADLDAATTVLEARRIAGVAWGS